MSPGRRYGLAAASVLGALAVAIWPARFLADRAALSFVDSLAARHGIPLSLEAVHLAPWEVAVEEVALAIPGDKKNWRVRAGRVVFELLRQKLRAERLVLERGATRFFVQAEMHIDRIAGRVSLVIPPTGCQALLVAAPPNLLPRLQGVVLEGKLALELSVTFDETQASRTTVRASLENGCQIRDFGALPRPELIRQPFEHTAYTAQKEAFTILIGPGSPSWVPLDEISPYLVEATLASEDPLFFEHGGVLIARFAEALADDLARRDFRFGASTITMQLAKNLFLSREKTISRKLQELFFSWYLESYFTKQEILELYLNVAEFGPSVYGVAAASSHYFGRLPQELNLRESVFIAKLLPRPLERHLSLELGQPTPELEERMQRLLAKLALSGRITEDEYFLAQSQPLVFCRGRERPEPRSPEVRFASFEEPLGLVRTSRPRLEQSIAPLSLLIGDRGRFTSTPKNP